MLERWEDLSVERSSADKSISRLGNVNENEGSSSSMICSGLTQSVIRRTKSRYKIPCFARHWVNLGSSDSFDEGSHVCLSDLSIGKDISSLLGIYA